MTSGYLTWPYVRGALYVPATANMAVFDVSGTLTLSNVQDKTDLGMVPSTSQTPGPRMSLFHGISLKVINSKILRF